MEDPKQAADPSLAKIMPLVIKLMNAGGWDIVKDALDSKDPARPLGAFFAELMLKVAQAATEKGMQIDGTVFMRPDGVLFKLLDIIEQHFGMPPEFSDEIFDEVVAIVEQSMAKSQQTQAGTAPQGAPTQPQAAPPPQGGPGLDAMGGM